MGITVALGVALVMACSNDSQEIDDEQFREDVIWCEESVAQLQNCCGSQFDPHAIACRHYYERDTGCNSTTVIQVDPAYTEDESRCIRNASCDQIRASNICARALAAGRARQSQTEQDDPVDGSNGSTASSTSSGSAATGPVCP